MEKLKPCPFCGEEASIEIDHDGNSYTLGCHKDEDCPGFQVLFIWHTDIGTPAEQECIDLWNKRSKGND